MIRSLAPTGSPITLRQILSCFGPVNNARGQINTDICQILGVKQATFYSTGRGAMTILLRALAKLSDNKKARFVVIPSYTCYSVAASVLKAGLLPLICDISPKTLSYKRDQIQSIDFGKVLAIVTANLYGIPDDLEWLESLATKNDTFLIDDAAQSLGATIGARPVGSFGTAGILSLDKGKVITSINGGIVITNSSKLAAQLDSLDDRPARSSSPRCWLELLKATIYAVFLHPSVYWLPRAMPFTGLGVTRYDETFQIEEYCSRLAPIAASQLQSLAALNASRIERADSYRENLRDLDFVSLIEPPGASVPIYLRFPIRISVPDARARILELLSPLGATGSYPLPIAEIPEIRDTIAIQNGEYSGGKTVADEIVTLPTHSFVTPLDIQTITRAIRSTIAQH